MSVRKKISFNPGLRKPDGTINQRGLIYFLVHFSDDAEKIVTSKSAGNVRTQGKKLMQALVVRNATLFNNLLNPEKNPNVRT